MNFFKWFKKKEVVKQKYNVGKTTLTIHFEDQHNMVTKEFVGQFYDGQSKVMAEIYIKKIYKRGFIEHHEGKYVPSSAIHRINAKHEDYWVEV